MAYVRSLYNDYDLAAKGERDQSNVADAVVGYAQDALNDLGSTDDRGRALLVDGKFGPRTAQSVKRFQIACGIPVTSRLDWLTWYQLDWRVYGLNGNGWRPTSKNVTNTKDYGPAIVNGCNEFLRPETPVNSIGQTREGQRLTDVGEAYLKRSLGFEGAVRRLTSSGTLSRHALGLAGDDMADQNKDAVVSADEMMLMSALWGMYYVRAQVGPGYVAQTLKWEAGGVQRSSSTGWRGLDRLSIMVLGNRAKPDGTLMFPGLTKNKDVSWSALRNTPKALTSTGHVWPFHLHTDCLPGAPSGSPF